MRTCQRDLKIHALSVLAVIFIFLGLHANAAVIDVQEWEQMPAWPWSGNGLEQIDHGVPPSPGATGVPGSGGAAVRYTYPQGTYTTSFTAGGLGIDLNAWALTDVYSGQWSRYSDPFTFNPIGNKFSEFVIDGRDSGNVVSNMQQGYGGGGLSQFASTNQIGWGNSDITYWCNVGNSAVPLGQWYWVQVHVRLNSVGGADGVYESWINGKPCASYINVQYRDTVGQTRWFEFSYPGDWGGGGGTIPQTGYRWIDHTVIATTKAETDMPGGMTNPNTTAPAPPRILAIK